MINVRKRGKVYQFQFEIAKINGKRKFINKSGFKTKKEAFIAGQQAYENYINGGMPKEAQMSYSDYLDYWMGEYFKNVCKYSTVKRYKETFVTIKKELGRYKLSTITPYMLNQTLLRLAQKVRTKEGLRNYQKVIKSSFRDAAYYFGFINYDPASDLRISKMSNFNLKKTQI